MQPLFPTLLAVLLYSGITCHQGLRLARRQPLNLGLLAGAGVLALLAHITSLGLELLPGDGLRLDFFHAASLIAASVVLLTLLACLRLPAGNLLLLLYPLAALTVLCAQFVPERSGTLITQAPGILAHILFSILAYGLLTIAMFQSLLLLIQERQLKNKHPSGLIRNFPPLQTMESLLFGFLWAGWLLLSLSLLSGWLYFDDLFARHLAHKTLLSCLAWVVFAILLWGRHQLGWRGHKAIRWTLAGFCLLMLAYFGSKLVREFLIN